MKFCHHTKPFVLFLTLAALAVISSATTVASQDKGTEKGVVLREGANHAISSGRLPAFASTVSTANESSALSRYFDPAQGVSSRELINRAIASNPEMAAARLEIARARARLIQSGLRPNPTIEFEQTAGGLTGARGERSTSIGFGLPIEFGGKRQRRIELAQAELEAASAEAEDRERRLAAEIHAAHVEALVALREMAITEQLNRLDIQTARIVEARVVEGEAAPIELNLLRAEADRLRSRRALVEGRLNAVLLRLKTLAGLPPNEQLRLKEDLSAPSLPIPPSSIEAAMDIAIKERPDIRLARLNEKAAEAGLRLATAQGAPEVTAFTRYSSVRSTFDDTPVGALRDKDNLIAFGVSIGLPVFNRNQGAKAEAAVAIQQARRRRESIEQLAKAEIASAYARYEAAQAALEIYEQSVIVKTSQNINSIRGGYELGAFRMTELLTEQRRLIDSERERTEAFAERYKALADLNSAIGAPLNPSMKQQ